MGVYRVEIDDDGCPQCQHDQTFHVIGPDEVASSVSYGDQEDAESLARALDRAYELGQQSVKVVLEDAWTPFAKGPPEVNGYVFVWDAQFKTASAIYYMPDSYPPEHLDKMAYTHWIPASNVPGPRDVPETEQPPTIEPAPTAEPPTIQPPPVLGGPREINSWDDDIPFGFMGLVPLAGLLAYAAKTLF